MRRIRAAAMAGALVALGAAGTAPPTAAATTSGLRFGHAIVIDEKRAGGEPIVYVDRRGTWVYSPHAGTTHFYKQGVGSAGDFLLPYRGQTYIYRCTAGIACGSSPGLWTYIDALAGLHSVGTGFSDPDFTEDSAGNLYHAEITLASTDLNYSSDDGKTWTANPLAPNGDRPWLAADGPGVVYLTMDPSGSAHTVYRSTDGGRHFDGGTVDSGTLPDGRTITGNGKLLVDPRDHAIYEPAWVYDGSGNIAGEGVGVSHDGGAHFTQHLAVNDRVYRTFWGMLTQDRGGTLYLLYDQADSSAAYSTRHSIAIRYVYSRDGGVHWSAPIDVTRPGVAVFWPWAVGGSDGNLGVAWYQSDRNVAIESEPSSIGIHAARITGANTGHPSLDIVDATGAPTHTGTVCQDGTACNAQLADDRRLGEYLTCTLDAGGHMIIAYSNTVDHPNSPVSRPGLVVQSGGPSFYSGGDLPGGSSGGGNGGTSSASGGGGGGTVASGGAGSGAPNTAGSATAAAGPLAALIGAVLMSLRRGRRAPPRAAGRQRRARR